MHPFDERILRPFTCSSVGMVHQHHQHMAMAIGIQHIASDGTDAIERISAEHLGQLLLRAYSSPVMPEMMASLPILSLDGTIRQRLKDSQSNGRAHLKTGSLNGVSAIAGYVLDANGHRHVLVMLVNHVNAAASKAAQDALIEWVHQQP